MKKHHKQALDDNYWIEQEIIREPESYYARNMLGNTTERQIIINKLNENQTNTLG